jgi:hypothetical protein
MSLRTFPPGPRKHVGYSCLVTLGFEIIDLQKKPQTSRTSLRYPLWQPRFFDRALRSVKEYYEKVEYIHPNPVRAGLVKRAEEWQWSSAHDYTGGLSATFRPNRTLASDREGYISG